MGAAFPNNPFTVVIFKKDRLNFNSAPEDFYNNKNICVDGTVKLYNGKPEIIVSNPDEITIQ